MRDRLAGLVVDTSTSRRDIGAPRLVRGLVNRSIISSVPLFDIDIFRLLDFVGNLVETNLLCDALAAFAVFDSGCIVEDLVHFLERQTFELPVSEDCWVTYLWKNEDRVQETNYAEAHEDNVCLVVDVVKHAAISDRPKSGTYTGVTIATVKFTVVSVPLSMSELTNPAEGSVRLLHTTYLVAEEILMPLARMSSGKTGR